MTHAGGVVCESQRLVLRLARQDDAAFLLRLLNQRSWIESIGDRNVRTPEQAARYIDERMLGPVDALGYGMYVVELKASHTAIGLCGLVRRDSLPGPDLGFALLDEHAGCGYAVEAAAAVMRHAQELLGIGTLLAITTPTNHRSARVLKKLGFSLREAAYAGPGGERLALYRAVPKNET